MTDIEKKAALALRPYFGPDPIVFDVGSNKGDWADILIRGVKEMHLFEPNEILLHYTMVRFDTLANVLYNALGICDKNVETDFYYFTNNNNGLSSIYYNPYWEELGLPMKKGKIRVTTLDNYYRASGVIDFIKIDVEGADYDVLVGAMGLLENNKIRFIQIEYSTHYALAGRSFEDVVPFVRQFGYDLFHFNGETFELRTDQKAENFYIMDKNFTQDWNSEFIKNTKGLPKFKFALEIGAFEGLTSNYICDNMLTPEGRMICVDPLTDEYLPGHKDNEMFKGQFERFTRNTLGKPIELIRKKSREAFEQLKDYRFDFIYIDGDHTENEVFNDAMNAWRILQEKEGYILFDDYKWDDGTRRGIDRFLSTQAGNYELLIMDYQVLIKRLW